MERKIAGMVVIGLIAAGVAGAAFPLVVLDGGDATPDNQTEAPREPASNVSQEAQEAQEIGTKLLTKVESHVNDPDVYVSSDGMIALDYVTTADSPDELEVELHQISKLYAESIENESDARTLAVITGKVQAIIPKSSLKAFVRGDINEEAFLETVEVTDVERSG